MTHGLDVIIVDDDPVVLTFLEEVIRSFYTWGEVLPFSDMDMAVAHCQNSEVGLAVFVVDVFLGDKTGFSFLDAVEEKFPTVHQDAIVITGKASDDVVNMCVAANIHYLIEKPVKKYALQLAVRSIVTKYIRFSKRLLGDPDFARVVAEL